MATDGNGAERALDGLVLALHARGRLRVWSLAVTVFGDAIVPRGGKAGLSVLQEIMGRLGIENGALRTAMSRLAADGWVVRERSGRNSIYALAGSGRRAFDEATRRIYAAGPPEWDGRWTVALLTGSSADERTAELAEAGFAHVGGPTWIRPETSAAPTIPEAAGDMLVIGGTSDGLPALADRFFDLEALAKSYRGLVEAFSPLHRSLETGDGLCPLEAMAARTLLIHDWRRAVLHDPGLPAELLPADWPGETARALVRSVYTRLAPASEHWLDEAGLPPQRDPTRFAARFGIFQSSR
ncbi:MAG: PaaX family transcriptional regulator C-terminal domain-containing protein [Rhizobiaceae bacterium]